MLGNSSDTQAVAALEPGDNIETIASPTTLHSEIVLSAHLDPPPSLSSLATYQSSFFILAASSHTTPPRHTGRPELPITYSGTGLLITPTLEYVRQHKAFDKEIADIERENLELEEVRKESARKDLKELRNWIKEVAQGGHWRRIGVVEFKDWSEEAWESVMGSGIRDVMDIQAGVRAEGKEAYPKGWGTEFWLD